MKRDPCRPVYVEHTMFGWVVRLPNGSAARGNDLRRPRCFKRLSDAIQFSKRRVLIGGGPHGEPTTWIRCYSDDKVVLK